MSNSQISRWLPWTALVALIGLGVAAAGSVIVSPRAFFAGWLAAYVYWLSLPLAALALLMVHDLAGGDWGVTLRPILEASVATLPIFVLLFLPIPVAGLAILYPWARPEAAAALPNTFYLNLPGFAGRAAGYYVLWLLFAAVTLRRSRTGLLAVDRSGSWVSAVGLIALVVTVTFAAFDWIMALEPHWSSTMFGMISGASQCVTAFAVLVLIAVTLGPATAPDRAPARRAFATILLVSVLFWAYVEFVQFLEVWEENLTDEIPWYIHRIAGGWHGVVIALAAGRFAVPFLVLIWAPAKRSRIVLGAMAVWLMAMNALYVWWVVLPTFFGGGFDWIAVPAMVGVGGLWFLAFLAWFRIADRVVGRRVTADGRLGHA